MITLRKSDERWHVTHRGQEAWLTFYPQSEAQGRADPLAGGFGVLELLEEDRLPPGARLPLHPLHAAEIVTYVLEGALGHDDSAGRSCAIRAGEFQRMSVADGIRHRNGNRSRTQWAHVFQIWLRPGSAGFGSSTEQKRFSAAERRGGLCIVASPDGRNGSLAVQQDALVYSAMLDRGQHIVHELSHGRRAWLQVVYGEALLGDLVLRKGDGAGITADRAVSLTAQEATEVLLVDLGA